MSKQLSSSAVSLQNLMSPPPQKKKYIKPPNSHLTSSARNLSLWRNERAIFILSLSVFVSIGLLPLPFCSFLDSLTMSFCNRICVQSRRENKINGIGKSFMVNIIVTLRFLCLNEQNISFVAICAVIKSCKDFATKRHLAPALMHFGSKSWSKMVVRWRYADLSMESSKNFYVLNVKATYATCLSMTLIVITTPLKKRYSDPLVMLW